MISDTEVAVYNEGIAIGVAGQTSYSGHLAHVPVVAGSVRVQAGGFYFVDSGGGILVGETGGTAGTIQYNSGSWSINLGGNDIDAGLTILANYIYQVPTP